MTRGRDRQSTVDGAKKMVTPDLADQNLKKHIAAIHINNRLTLTQRKASNVLLYNAYESLLTARVHRIRVKDLAEAIGFNTHNLDPLKEALKTLARTLVEWNILDEKGQHEEWGSTTLLAQAVIRGGYCVYAYSPELCEKLYRPEIYALLNLSIQRKFSSSYALALYENCLRYRRIGTTGWIALDILKRLLGINEADLYYQDFRKFNDKVIKPAVRQVNDTSDLLLEIDYQREHRKIAAVRFRVTDNPQMVLFAQHQAELAHEGPPTEAPTEDPPEVPLESGEHLRGKLLAMGLSTHQVQMALARYESAYLEDNIAVVERDMVAGKIHNLPAYLLAALRQDYRPSLKHGSAPTPYSVTPVTPSVTPDCTAAAVPAIDPLAEQEQMRTRFLTLRLQQALDALSLGERQALEEDYRERLEQGNNFESRLILGLYRKNGLRSKMVECHFRAFARERLVGTVDDADWLAYLAQQHHPSH